jgi:AraC family transcriptional regulator
MKICEKNPYLELNIMITNEVINKSIDYIMKNIDTDISINDVAKYCHYSKYYFSRAFKEATGVSIYAFIKRLKMDYSAIMLLMEKDKTITDIGLEFGYSSSNYSSAFRKHHSKSPAEFRKNINTAGLLQSHSMNEKSPFRTFDEYDKNIRIQKLEDFVVIYERHIGNYMELEKNWNEFTKKYKDYFKKNTLMIERSYDDPSITDSEQCIYDICITVDKNCTLDNITTINGGNFVVYRFDGVVQDVNTAFQGLLHIWLASSGYVMDRGYCLDIYRSIDEINKHVVMDLCIPIK